MTTRERIQHLVQSGQSPELLGEFDGDDITAWLTAELGHPDALDQFHPHGPLLSKAFAPQNILHIVSGNTPHAAIQSLLRGLLLGSYNIVKTPSTGIPELSAWIKQLPAEINYLIEVTTSLDDDHWRKANAIVAIGSDDTITSIQQKILPHQTFIPHGHKVSMAIALKDFTQAADLAAKDVSLFNQRGCLSPHAIYVKEKEQGEAKSFAQLLAHAMEKFAQAHPPEPLTLSEAGAVRNLRETTRFSAANSDEVALWESKDTLEWTVVYEASPTLKLSCLNRCVYVKPLPKNINLSSLGPEAQHLSTIAQHPFDQTYAEELTHLPAHRFCPLGKSQKPSLFWHHDGFAPLASLVQWKDLG